MYRICNSYADQSACVADLANASFSLKQMLGNSDEDARTVALDNIGSIAVAGQMSLNLLDSWAKGDNIVRQIIPQLIGLTPVTPQSVKTAGDIIGKNAKLALIVLAQFQVENVLRNIHRELRLGPPLIGFYRCAKMVIHGLALSPNLLEILNVPARIRNSLHSNGIHHRQHPAEVCAVNINGVNYEFCDGNKVTCASWEHIAHALESSVGVLQSIFHHPRTMALPDPIMDQYAWEEATNPTR
jgi:hypothetical protein